MSRVRTIAYCLMSIAASTLCSGIATAQEYPTRPVRIITPLPAGSTTVLAARVVGEEMAKTLGQPVIIESKPGAGGQIAYEYVARQVPADGYTIVQVTVESYAIMASTVKDLRFDPAKDLIPIIGLVEGRMVLASSSKFPWKNFNEFVDYAKANPGKLNYGTTTLINSVPFAVLKSKYNLNMVDVNYPAFIQALLSGEVHAAFAGESLVVPAGDKLRVLAVTGNTRQCPFCDAPTFAELGFPQIPSVSSSLSAPVGIPKGAFDRLHASASRALQQPEVRSSLAKIQWSAVGGSSESAAKLLVDRLNFFNEMSQQMGIKPQ